MTNLSPHIDQIRNICAANNVKTLFAFGSVTNSGFNAQSDVDLIVDIDESDPLLYSDHYFRLKFQLELLLSRSVDLLENKAVKNPYLRKEIERTKVSVYKK